MAAHSPALSPRLPSPPPIAEDQVGPTSPGVSLFEDHGKLPPGAVDTGASRRIRPGTRADDMAEGPPLVELQEIDSAFPLTEHLKAMHYSYTHPPDSNTTIPITAEVARQLASPPPSTNNEIWLYELGRFLIQKTNSIIVALFADSPSCSSQTCPEMRASEWQYLCAVHDPPKSCSAIDYCCHTLDWAATTLTSSKMFPSRLGLGSGSAAGSGDKVLQQQLKEIKDIFRRVYRIYAHAWFQHREMFWRVEGKTGLYVLFKTVCDEYGMIQAENYTIPPEAEGREPEIKEDDIQQAPSVLKREEAAAQTLPSEAQEEPAGNHTLAAGDTTKRHRHTVSDRAPSVTTVIQEEVEEEDDRPEKPGLDRKTTTLRDATKLTDEAQEASSEAHKPADDDDDDDNIDEPIPGVFRSNTLKPPKEPEVSAEESSEPTAVEPAAESTSEIAPEAQAEYVDQSEPSENGAEEAEKPIAN